MSADDHLSVELCYEKRYFTHSTIMHPTICIFYQRNEIASIMPVRMRYQGCEARCHASRKDETKRAISPLLENTHNALITPIQPLVLRSIITANSLSPSLSIISQLIVTIATQLYAVVFTSSQEEWVGGVRFHVGAFTLHKLASLIYL
ncbi:hypothetical protein ACTXT7_001449 [Hymenolepis weldensis]